MKKFILSIIIISSVVLNVGQALAFDITYEPLEPAVLGTGGANAADSFPAYAQAIFTTILSLLVVLSVLMIIWGGFSYIVSTIPSVKMGGKERVQGAIYGLLLALCAWLILNTINPDILNWQLLFS